MLRCWTGSINDIWNGKTTNCTTSRCCGSHPFRYYRTVVSSGLFSMNITVILHYNRVYCSAFSPSHKERKLIGYDIFERRQIRCFLGLVTSDGSGLQHFWVNFRWIEDIRKVIPFRDHSHFKVMNWEISVLENWLHLFICQIYELTNLFGYCYITEPQQIGCLSVLNLS